MPKVENALLKICLNSSFTKKEKLKKMYVYIRENRPELNKDKVFDYCMLFYDEVQKGKKSNSSFYFG